MKETRLVMRKFIVQVCVVNPMVDVVTLGVPTHTFETREIEGYTLKDAKRRANID